MLAWLFYAYLWLPLATAVVWWFGLADIYGELYQRSEQVDRFVVFALPAAAAITGFALIGWAEYNRLRFRGNERRAPFRDVPIDEIAAALGASPGVPHALAEVRVAILDMNEDAEPVAVIPVLPVDRRSPA